MKPAESTPAKGSEMPNKVIVFRLTQAEGDGCFLAVQENALDAIADAMHGSEPGDSFTVTVEEWDRKKLDDLPEWDGW